MILYGPPGTGKTSIIKAIAAEFDFDILLIDPLKVDITRMPKNDKIRLLVIEDIDLLINNKREAVEEIELENEEDIIGNVIKIDRILYEENELKKTMEVFDSDNYALFFANGSDDKKRLFLIDDKSFYLLETKSITNTTISCIIKERLIGYNSKYFQGNNDDTQKIGIIEEKFEYDLRLPINEVDTILTLKHEKCVLNPNRPVSISINYFTMEHVRKGNVYLVENRNCYEYNNEDNQYIYFNYSREATEYYYRYVLGVKTGGVVHNSQNQSGKKILRDLMNAIDGLITQENFIIIATTNSIETLDPALIRPGRFDTAIKIDYIDIEVFNKVMKQYFGKTTNGILKKEKLIISQLQVEFLMGKDFEYFVNKYINRM